ncbi:alpha-1,4 glucan phosphorylase [Clostridia bacterium]|nr:alpha-1,4 glucan phosphorylase [Clostridia bacterium]
MVNEALRQTFMDSFLMNLRTAGYAAPKSAPPRAVHSAIAKAAVGLIADKWQTDQPAKTACYLSAEFLTGRLVYNNLLCLGLLEDARSWLADVGVDLGELEEIEDAALGNGGLGRLAACFLDSAAALGLPVTGYGIRYKYGLFRQTFENGFQRETGDDWHADEDPWSVRREASARRICFKDQTVMAVPYDMPIIGYGGARVGTLRLWQSEACEPFDFDLFNQQKYAASVKEKNEAEDISRTLYPNDDTPRGKALRLRQEYFFSAATIGDLLDRCHSAGRDVRELPEMFAIQLNDTHPVIAIPELIRRLVDEDGLKFVEAFGIARRVFNYTNHTIMIEAMETWKASMLRSLLPRILEIINEIQLHLERTLAFNDVPRDQVKRMSVLRTGVARMAPLAIFASSHTNGVAKIHTEILCGKTLKDWYDVWPERFLNETNGITFRRWLGLCNPELTQLVNGLTQGDVLREPMRLERLAPFADDDAVLDEFAAIKQCNKAKLADAIAKREGIAVDPTSIFDIQIKRLHEYKRQLMNALNILMLYNDFKDGLLKNPNPVTFIFGAKAAPGYRRAKAIIKLINEIGRQIRSDPAARELFNVIFVQNYNVSWAEEMVPAADISEQISMAGTEASGTGNMKFMLNGTVTLGTYDGANVEIVEAAGREHNFIFGADVDEIERLLPHHDPKALLKHDARLCRAMDALTDSTLDDNGTGMFAELRTALLDGASWHVPDHYYVLGDMAAYDTARKQAFQAYGSREFTRMGFVNMCHAGRFSSDLTIADYAKRVWHITA